MIAYKYKLYSNARNGHLDSQIDQFPRCTIIALPSAQAILTGYSKQSVTSMRFDKHMLKTEKGLALHWIAGSLPSQAGWQDVARSN